MLEGVPKLIRERLEQLGAQIPLVADVHHNGWKIAAEVARHVAKVRINPGLFVFRKPGSGIEWDPAEVLAEREVIRKNLAPVVTACQECNLIKGDRMPKDCGMHPLRPVFQPTTYQLQENGRAYPPNFLHVSWNDFLYWDSELED